VIGKMTKLIFEIKEDDILVVQVPVEILKEKAIGYWDTESWTGFGKKVNVVEFHFFMEDVSLDIPQLTCKVYDVGEDPNTRKSIYESYGDSAWQDLLDIIRCIT
jgi:hypothetical protein